MLGELFALGRRQDVRGERIDPVTAFGRQFLEELAPSRGHHLCARVVEDAGEPGAQAGRGTVTSAIRSSSRH